MPTRVPSITSLLKLPFEDSQERARAQRMMKARSKPEIQKTPIQHYTSRETQETVETRIFRPSVEIIRRNGEILKQASEHPKKFSACIVVLQQSLQFNQQARTIELKQSLEELIGPVTVLWLEKSEEMSDGTFLIGHRSSPPISLKEVINAWLIPLDLDDLTLPMSRVSLNNTLEPG